MTSLSLEQINALLKGESTTNQPKTSPHEKPIQIGPLSYVSETAHTCTSRRCGSTTMIKIDGVSYCSTHALYTLNEIWLREHELSWVIDECNCNSGKFSKHNIHNEDCAIYNRLKEYNNKSVEKNVLGQL